MTGPTTRARRNPRAVVESPSSAFVPRRNGKLAPLPVVAAAARGCTACALWERATQTVFGEGKASASIMLVGEQPGDQEDRAGRPFVGPAGGILARALEEAGIRREDVYLTNAVKHFSFVEKGKRRLHQKPKGHEVKACQGWLTAEIELVRPQVVICLGATAALSLLGPKFRLTKARGQLQPALAPGAPVIAATYHPSAILRAPDSDARQAMFGDLVKDLRAVAGHVRRAGTRSPSVKASGGTRPDR